MGIFRSLRVRLTLWYVLLLAIALAAFGAAIYLTLRYSLNEGLDDSVENRAELLSGLVEYSGGTPSLAGTISSNDLNADDTFVRVYGPSGGLSFEQAPPGTTIDDNTSSIERARSGGTSRSNLGTSAETYRVIAVPLMLDAEVTGVLEVGESTSDIDETLGRLLLILAVGYPITLVAASVGGVFLAGRALSPIDKITQAARRISAEDLGRRLDLDLPDDEVGRLARTFDDMIARLEDAFVRQRQFTSDASHELRTPLTAMKGQVEVALSKERPAADYRGVLQTVNQDIDRMIRLVGSLLTLARADAHQVALEREQIRLAELVNSAVAEVQQVASERGVTLVSKAGPDVGVMVDEDLMLQLLLNLLDNAIKYSGPAGHVECSWRSENGSVEMSVHDSGQGILANDLPHIFDRFYRADKSRAHDGGGAGLGLSISKWIAEAHGGDISVRSTPGSGTTFTVHLPAS